ncbi:MAG TPA: sensor histidine kinase [Verrucomicrobiae bacterium]|jgi:signal transduction histidine kinase
MTRDISGTERSTQSGAHPKALWVGLSLGIVAVVGFFDYFTGFELNFFAFYLIPVILGVWTAGWGFGIFVSALCVVVSVAGDKIAGARYSSPLVPVWNTAIYLTFFLVVVWIVARLRSLQLDLEERVRQRTAALNNEMQERMRLEEEILSISEREQQRLGRDLHDSLCQHLTGVALAGEVLSEQLAAQAKPEAKAVDHIVQMVEGAIELTRTLARGLHPIELMGEGFTDALRELAATVTEGLKTLCTFECDKPVEIVEPAVATHLYRIAQEAITNAVKHSNAKSISVRLESEDGGLTLAIADDGRGMPAKIAGGMGLRTMAYRASVIGASFSVEPRQPAGTCVICKLPAQAHDAKN